MKKILNKNICFMGILITILELAVMFSTPYSKSVLAVYPLNNIIWSFVLFAVFFFVFSGFVIFCFTKLSFSLYKKQIAKSFFTLLLIRVILDLGSYIVQSIEVRALYSLITDSIFTVILFQIIVSAYTGKNLLKDLFSRFKAKDKYITIVVLLYTLVVVISTSYLSYTLIKLLGYTEKYTMESYFYLFQSMTCIFNSQLLKMFTAIISQILLLIIINKLYEEKTDEDLYWSKSLVKVIARSMVAFVAVFILLFVKICISTVGFIDLIPTRISNGYIGLPNITSNSYTKNKIYRSAGEASRLLSYENTDVTIKYHDEELLSFTLNNFYDYEYTNKEQNKIENANSGASVTIQDQEIVFFSNQYIAFAVNNTPYVIAFEDIYKEDENKVLTTFIEYMVSCGYWDYFEYGCDYLLKYDPEFINPYIERYAKGDFTEIELETNYDIKTEYMVNFAQKYISTVN